jgi:quercetin dioxygenase-like cupin family protein
MCYAQSSEVSVAQIHLFDSAIIDWTEHPQFPGLFIKVLEARATNPGASVTLTRLAAGKSIGTHSHPVETETAYILSGEARLVAGDAEQVLTMGAGVSVFPTTPHSLHNDGDNDVILLAVHVPPVR